MGFSTLDYIIVSIYLIGVTVLGVAIAGKQTSSRDYFLGGKNIPWWAACFAIVATETSTLTFISIPGLAYLTNLNFLQVTCGYLIGRIVVSMVFLPAYTRGELQTAYTLLGTRFGPKTRNVASVTFMFTRLLADGVRLFATAIPLALLLKGWNTLSTVTNEQIYVVAIVVMAALTLVYTYIGGVKAVIWTDVVQMFIYLLGAVVAIMLILSDLSEGWTTMVSIAEPLGKLSIINWGFEKTLGEFFAAPYTLFGSLVGGAFLSMASHGTDQLIVQRLLTVRTLPESRRALIGSGIIVFFQFAIFLVIGLLLYAYYGGAALADLGVIKADEIFPKFIIERIPSGLSGIIIAGLLAAAMSTLSGSVNSLAAATVNDIYKPYFARAHSDENDLKMSRLFSLIWAALLVVVAIFFIFSGSKVLVEIALGIASFTYGGLLGVFLLGVLTRRTTERDAIGGFTAGIIVMVMVFISGKFGWTWYTMIGSVVTVGVGTGMSLLMRSVNTRESIN